MKNFRNLFAGLFVLSFGVFVLGSCNNEKDNPAPLNAVVDVYIQDIKTDAAVKYGIFVYAMANYDIKTAKVNAPGTGGKVYQLTATSKKNQFVFIPQTADYTSDLPLKGDYSFEIISTSNEKITGKDVVGNEKLSSIAIKSATMTNHLLKTMWDKVQGTDVYVVRFYSANKAELLFQSTTLASDKVEYEFGTTTSGWAIGKSPVVNTNYVVELVGAKFETGVTTDKGNNVQFITLDSKIIKWE
jgi:hypothetical protein